MADPSNLKEVNGQLFTTPRYVRAQKGDPSLRFAGKLALNSGDSVHVATTLLVSSDDLISFGLQTSVASNYPLNVLVGSINPGNAIVFVTANSEGAADVVGADQHVMWEMSKL